jgi:oligopeptide transport system ATP-binding protein
MPSNDADKTRGLKPIEGTPPDLFDPPVGCSYFARCPYAMRVCEPNHPPPFALDARHYSRCWLQHAGAPPLAPDLYRGAAS